MKYHNRRIITFLLCILVISILPITAKANSAEPPSIIIKVNNPPTDLSIFIIAEDGLKAAKFKRAIWEGYYIFYHDFKVKENDAYTLVVSTQEQRFECKFDHQENRYNRVFLLNLATHALTPGEYPLRSVLLIAINIMITFIIEGALFWLFGYRKKRSWIVFISVNLITQGILNYWLNNHGFPFTFYSIFGLFFAEIVVFIAELTGLLVFTNEHKPRRTVAFTLSANLLSFITGAFIIVKFAI